MSKAARANPIHYLDWLTLLGFQSESYALDYVKKESVEAIESDAEWLTRIRTAIAAVEKISDRSKLVPEVQELDHRFQRRTESIAQEETFKEHLVGMKSHRFAMVELAPLHCYQTQLNTEYVDSLAASAPNPQDPEGTVRYCLPTRDERPGTRVLTWFNPTTNTFSATTENLDFRFTGNVTGDYPKTGRSFSGFTYGFGRPEMLVVDYKGTLLLKNGYHRAYALLRKGHRFLPCLLMSTDSFQATGAQSPNAFSADLIMSDKSPVMSDFATDAAILVPRRRLRVLATIHAEVQKVPM